MNITNWFTGVVEDVADPLQQGRVKVRCFTYHNSSQEEIPTSDLPWATCMMPVTSASTSEIGQSATGLLPGSWVFGLFRDAKELQDPFILGSIPSSSMAATGNTGTGFGDPHGVFPISAGADIPSGATTNGFSTNIAYAASAGGVQSFNNTGVGYGTTAETFHGPTPPITVNGSIENVISAARSQVGVRETSMNQGPGIAKYWAATDYKSGYNDRQPWCAAFVCWCIQQSGIFTEEDRPKSAAAFKGGGFESWARSKAPRAVLKVRPTFVRAGDLVIFSFSHIGIATSHSDGYGNFKTVEGNTNAAGAREGNGVWEKSRNLSKVRSAVTIT